MRGIIFGNEYWQVSERKDGRMSLVTGIQLRKYAENGITFVVKPEDDPNEFLSKTISLKVTAVKPLWRSPKMGGDYSVPACTMTVTYGEGNTESAVVTFGPLDEYDHLLPGVELSDGSTVFTDEDLFRIRVYFSEEVLRKRTAEILGLREYNGRRN